MPKNVKVSDVITALKLNGFVRTGHSNHGDTYSHANGKQTTISTHYKNGTIPVGTLKAMEQQTGLKFS